MRPVALFDSNVWVSAFLNPFGTPAQLKDAWLAGRLDVVTSVPLLAEGEEKGSLFGQPQQETTPDPFIFSREQEDIIQLWSAAVGGGPSDSPAQHLPSLSLAIGAVTYPTGDDGPNSVPTLEASTRPRG